MNGGLTTLQVTVSSGTEAFTASAVLGDGEHAGDLAELLVQSATEALSRRLIDKYHDIRDRFGLPDPDATEEP